MDIKGYKMNIFQGIKKLGFGLMRLPLRNNKIDPNEFKRMVDFFISSGYSYFDTAPGYMNGYSESFFKDYVSSRYPRNMYQIATKLPAWDLSRIQTKQDVVKVFNNSIFNTGVEFFDYYLLHNIGGERTSIFEKYKVWDFVQKCKRDGLIKYYGISFHGSHIELEEIINKHPDIDFVQLQINYADWNNKQINAKGCYKVAASHNKPIIVMEPLKGGTLFTLPDSVTKELQIVSDMTPAQWAFKWLESLSHVKLVLSGMSSFSQMFENISIYNNITPLLEDQVQVIKKVQKIIEKKVLAPCTGCLYCRSVCPLDIPIDQILASLNINHIFNNYTAALNKYSFQTRDGNKASTCLKCKRCEKICPQQIPIMEYINKATNLFDL